MNQYKSGQLITQKRKEHNMTQAMLAEKLGVSNKSVSKWETGKCMPDYSLMENLCEHLNISVTELLSGEISNPNETAISEKQMVDMMERIQKLEKDKITLFGIALIVMGIAFIALSQMLGGSSMKDFFSGVMMGSGSVETIVGIYLIFTSLK